MKSIVIVVAVCCAISGASEARAQTPADCKPSSLNIAEAK